jgi:putative effector of murein hydrolase
VLAPTLFKIFRIEEPIAQGLAMGTASHAIGTSKALELGEIQGAMGSLAIAVTGVMTVIIGPIVAGFY